jgi:hypothetical protein
MRRPFTVPMLLAVGGLAWAGVHLAAHRLGGAAGGHAGHGHEADQAAYLSTSLSLCLSLAIVIAAAASVYPAWRGATGRSLWLFGAVPLLGLFGGAVLDSGGTLAGLGANTAELLPVALLVLVVQVAVALSAVRVARGLLDLVEGAARMLAGPQTAAVPAGAHSFSLLDSDRVPGDRLVLSGGARAPPVSFSAV